MRPFMARKRLAHKASGSAKVLTYAQIWVSCDKSVSDCALPHKDSFNYMFNIDIILFKYCANKSEALQLEGLRNLFGAYSQSYPHNLWVRNFLRCNKKLRSYDESFSSYRKQLSDTI